MADMLCQAISRGWIYKMEAEVIYLKNQAQELAFRSCGGAKIPHNRASAPVASISLP